MKIGDKVRFLSEVGGGIVKGFQGTSRWWPMRTASRFRCW